MRHEYYKSCGRDECDGGCNLCTLAVCKNCGLAEGSLTTECPGKIEDYAAKADAVYAAQLDYRAGQWVQGCTIHLLSRVVELWRSDYVALEPMEKIGRAVVYYCEDHLNAYPFDGKPWLRPGENHRVRFAG